MNVPDSFVSRWFWMVTVFGKYQRQFGMATRLRKRMRGRGMRILLLGKRRATVFVQESPDAGNERWCFAAAARARGEGGDEQHNAELPRAKYLNSLLSWQSQSGVLQQSWVQVCQVSPLCFSHTPLPHRASPRRIPAAMTARSSQQKRSA